MTASRKAMMAAAGQVGGAAVLAESTDFDGTNDYLSKASDLTGNADGKTFTISAWVYPLALRVPIYYNSAASADNIGIELDSGGKFSFINQVSSATRWNISSTAVVEDLNTWQHILFSFDADTQSNCKLYINDVAIPLTFTTFSTGTNVVFTSALQVVNAISWALSVKTKGRAAHVYLDYTYRNLATELERRKFVTADLKPASEASLVALSPILYLPMTDPTTVNVNSGTGGDFTLNGTIARSGRAPNQDNCVASTLDNTNDYLSDTAVTGLADSKTFTFSCNFQLTSANNDPFISAGVTSSAQRLFIRPDGTSSITLNIGASNAAAATILSASIVLPGVALGASHNLQLSVDLANASNRVMILDGVDITPSVTWTTYTDDTIDLVPASSPVLTVGNSCVLTNHVDGNLGEVWFDTVYTDLATDNPFWDSDLGKPVSVRKAIDDSGVTPLIAYPMIGSDAGNNLGSGGDATVNSGPFTGARGASEFWARSVDFDGSTDYYSRASALTGLANGKTFTFVIAYKSDTGTTDVPFEIGSQRFRFRVTTGGTAYIKLSNSVGTEIADVHAASSPATGNWGVYLISFDMADTGKRHFYINGVIPTVNYYLYTNDAIGLSAAASRIGTGVSLSTEYVDGDIGFLYFNDAYTDFSDEATRLLFVDGLGFPRDLTQDIEDGAIPSPIIYMKFDDTSDFTVNLGTGGAFTENGTPVAGSDVNP